MGARGRWWSALSGAVLLIVAVACVPPTPPPDGDATASTVDGLSFVPATWNTDYVEEAPYTDNGGLLHVRVDNPLAVDDRISSVTVNGTPVDDLRGLRWWRVWPPVMSPAGTAEASSVVTIKSITAPLRGGETVTVRVETESGQVTTRTATLRGATLRVGSAVVSQDRTAVHLFLRNRSSAPLTVDRVSLNDRVWAAGLDTGISTPDGSWDVAPDRVIAVRVALDAPLADLAPLVISARATGAVPGGAEHVTAPIRMVEPTWAMGTWNSELPEEAADDHRAAKAFLVDQHVGSASQSNVDFANRYRIRVNAQRFSSPAEVVARRGERAIRSWLLADEPDLHDDAQNTSTSINDRVMEWRALDPTHPMWVNFAMQRKFNEYGQLPDITGVDHYTICAPNAIFGTGAVRIPVMEEALDYVDVLKDNTEPLPMWVWPQLAAGSWTCQPDAWGVSTQFWLSVMGGADGINWFMWNAHDRTDPRFAKGYAQGARDIRVARQIAGTLTYGEIEHSSVSSNPRISTRTVVGLDSQVVMACNLNYSAQPPAWAPNWNNRPSAGTLTVDVPNWVATSEVHQVTPAGTIAAPHSVSGSTVSIPVSLDDECAVYTIGAPDTAAPAQPTGLTRAESDTLAWDEGFDDRGIAGYRVYRDGLQVATTDAAVFRTPELADPGTWTVRAVDSAGNLSPPSGGV